MKSTHTGEVFTINELKTKYTKKEIDFNAEYQRSEVWSLTKKQKLIDSILKGYSIGMLFFKEREDGVLEVLDGQQRLKALLGFIGIMGDKYKFNTNPKITTEHPDIGFEDIDTGSRQYADLISFKIPYTLVRGYDDCETAQMFLLCQEGLPLNAAEKLNSMLGEMRTLVYTLSRHRFLKKTYVSECRFGHRFLCAQLCLLELKSNFDVPFFPNVTDDELKKMYIDYKTYLPKGLGSKIKHNFILLGKVLGDDAELIWYRGDFIGIYLLISYIDRKYVLNGNEKKFREFIADFLDKVNNIIIRGRDSFESWEEPYRIFKETRRFQTTKNLRDRFDVILREFLIFTPDLKLKAKTREFDYGQKIAIYRKDNNGECFRCRKHVSFKKADFHHKKFFSKGGPTTVENGAIMHPSCHDKLHASDHD